MKPLSTKTLLALLAAALVAYFALDYYDQSDSTIAVPASLSDFSVSQVTEARITQQGKTLRIYRKDGSWRLDLGQYQPLADSNIVLRGLNNLASIKPTRLISKQKEKWAEYQVDTSGIRAELFDASQKKIADLMLGGLEPYGRSQSEVFSYVRATDSDLTYSSPGFASESVSSKSYIYRTKTLISCMKDSISFIVCTPKGQPSFQMDQTSPGNWKIGNAKCDSAAANGWASALESVSSIKFVDGAALTAEVASVQVFIRNKAEPIVVKFYTKDEQNLLAVSSMNPQNVFEADFYDKVIQTPASLRK